MWGGWAFYWYYKYFSQKDIKISYIIDKNVQVQGETQFEIPVVSAEEILNKQDLKKCKFVVTAPKYRQEIINEITKEFGDVKIYSFEAEIYYSFIPDVTLYRKYLLDNFENLNEFYNTLADQKSKDTLTAFLKGRISANQKYFIDIMMPDQYFPKDIILLGADEVIVEAGSNDGRTLEEMIEILKDGFRRIYCFEPDRVCIEMLEKIIAKENNPISLIKKGVGESVQTVKFKTDSIMGGSRVILEGEYDYTVEITTIDDEIKENVTMIKMDIEGLELAALKGARRMIEKCAPKLAICVYHNKEDILEIWQWLKKVQPEYKFYLRHHNWGATETVLYAVAE